MNLPKNTCALLTDIFSDLHNKMQKTPKRYEFINKGCYADIFLLTFDDETQCVLKLFRFSGIAERELISYDFISRYNALPIPKLLCSNADKNYICMEYIKGCSLSRISIPSDVLSVNAVNCLINCHSYSIDVSSDESTLLWEKEFGKRQVEILLRSQALVKDGILEQSIYDIFESSVSALHCVLGNSIQKLSLLHGDYTSWNIMVDPETEQIISVLDPYLSCFGDREYDLMMLNKSNGEALKLLETYQKYIPLSREFARKTIYYNSWNELCHYFYSDRKTTMNISERAYELGQVIGH